ncbi:hypothetical protein JW710_03810 [Candidatus Dojkabacteria bacterium]|nr:hypothetical protein [Candidatus Dojkabacteria bacterium]
MNESLANLNRYLNGKFGRSPNFRLSSIYRNLLKDSRTSSFGDFPVLAYLVSFANANSRNFSRNEILHALNQSQELSKLRKKIKTVLLDQLQSYQQNDPNISTIPLK